jgi:hypothetical protein
VQIVTPLPTTGKPEPLPDYAVQGVASPIIRVQHCEFGKLIECPVNYVISVRKFFYGASTSQTCGYT